MCVIPAFVLRVHATYLLEGTQKITPSWLQIPRAGYENFVGHFKSWGLVLSAMNSYLRFQYLQHFKFHDIISLCP
jgi:hypothetical protein